MTPLARALVVAAAALLLGACCCRRAGSPCPSCPAAKKAGSTLLVEKCVEGKDSPGEKVQPPPPCKK